LHKAVAEFCEKVTRGQDVLFYYSGHGVVHPKYGHLLMCREWEHPPSGDRLFDADHAGVRTQDTMERIAARVGPNGSLVAFLDTCREQIAHAGGGGFKGAGMSHEKVTFEVEGVNMMCCHACRDSGLASAGHGTANYSPYTEKLLQVRDGDVLYKDVSDAAYGDPCHGLLLKNSYSENYCLDNSA
jgi:hypothetical protein